MLPSLFFCSIFQIFLRQILTLMGIDALKFNIMIGETDFIISKSLKNSSSILIDTEKMCRLFFSGNWKHSAKKLAGQYGTKEGRDTICGPTVVVVKAVDVDSPDPSVVALDDWMVSV